MNQTQESVNEEIVANEQLKNVTHNRELMLKAREFLKGKWGTAAGAVFILTIITIPISIIPIAGPIINFIIGGAFTVGIALFWLSIIRQKTVKKSQIFSGFKIFWKCFVAKFMTTLFILLWSLLLIVPGIMAAYSYAMTFFIIADNPEIRALEAIKESKKIMYGHRWKLFCLMWRFFGWMLLSILTLGIGFFWLFAYMGTSFACFYEDIKQKK